MNTQLETNLHYNSIIIKPNKQYKDKRGIISMINENTDMKSISHITSEPNTERASHWHFSDTHICYVIKGEIEYYERKANTDEKPRKYTIKEGESFFTDSFIEHTMFFPVYTEFLCLSKLSRYQKNYESDTTRLSESLRAIYDGEQNKT